ncbi:MAG: hypothetical protein WC712_07530 [Candidatus Brocadiia bacterium]
MENRPVQESRINSYVYAAVVASFAVLVALQGYLPYLSGTNISLTTLLLPVAMYCALQWRLKVLIVVLLLASACYLTWWIVRPSSIDIPARWGDVESPWALYILWSGPVIALGGILLLLKCLRSKVLALLGCVGFIVVSVGLLLGFGLCAYAGLVSNLNEMRAKYPELDYPSTDAWKYTYRYVDLAVLWLATSIAVFLVYRTELKPKVAYPLAIGVFLASFLIRPALDLFLTK